MADEGSTHLGTDTLPPTGYLQPRRFRVTCRCDVCGLEYSWETEKVSKRNRPCPAPDCVEIREAERAEKTAARRTKMLDERRGPAQIGNNVSVKAVDKTAEIVMEDYGMTNLQDNVRAGDMIAPKLPPQQQKLADSYFGGGQAAAATGIDKRRAELLKRRAVAGAFRNMAVNPKVTDFGRGQGESPLSVLRTEKIS